MLLENTFSNFIQRLEVARGTHWPPFHDAHNKMIDLYSQFRTNSYLIEFLNDLQQEKRIPQQAEVEVVLEDILTSIAFNEDEWFNMWLRSRPNALRLNYKQRPSGAN